MSSERGRDQDGRPRQQRPRDHLGRPLPFGTPGVDPVSEEALAPRPALSLARELLEAGRPFAAHEVLEARWKAAPASERDLWQGLAQLCVGLTHAARGNPSAAETLIERGAARLNRGSWSSTVTGVEELDLAAVINWARATLAQPDGATAPPDGWPR